MFLCYSLYLASHQVSNNWIVSVSFIVMRDIVNYNQLIYNAHNLLCVALIKTLVSSIAWALHPKVFIISSN